MKLKVELFRYGTLVFGKILEQDESLREKGEITTNYDYAIESIRFPEIAERKLFVRGEVKDSDNKIMSKRFADEDSAIRWCEHIKQLIDRVNGQETESIERVI